MRPKTRAERSELVRDARRFVDRHLGDRDLSLALIGWVVLGGWDEEPAP